MENKDVCEEINEIWSWNIWQSSKRMSKILSQLGILNRSWLAHKYSNIIWTQGGAWGHKEKAARGNVGKWAARIIEWKGLSTWKQTLSMLELPIWNGSSTRKMAQSWFQ